MRKNHQKYEFSLCVTNFTKKIKKMIKIWCVSRTFLHFFEKIDQFLPKKVRVTHQVNFLFSGFYYVNIYLSYITNMVSGNQILKNRR